MALKLNLLVFSRVVTMMLSLACSRLLIRRWMWEWSPPSISARRALVSFSLYGSLVRPMSARGEVFALLLRLSIIIILVRVPIMFVVIVLTFILEISPMEIWVLGPEPCRLQTNRVRLLTEQTLRRGGGETRSMPGTER